MNIETVFRDFESKRILVVGDVMIDAYLKGKVNRISPEAPVPIINLESREERLGGAANVAMNIKAMGATPILCSVVGDDSGAARFNRLLEMEGLTTEGMVRDKQRTTSVKTRVLGNNQQLLRIDEERVENLTPEQEKALIAAVTKLILEQTIDALIFEDYNKGTLTPHVISELTRIASKHQVITTVDPKFANFLAFENVTLFKPNLKELSEGLGKIINYSEDKSEFEASIMELESKLKNQYSFVTLSEHGVYMKYQGEQHYIPAHRRSIADVSGAGDTVIAVATLCLCSGLSPKFVAEIANLAGGLVCEHRGVVPIDKNRLKEEVTRTLK